MISLEAIRARYKLPDNSVISRELDEGLSLPTAFYVDPDVLDLEYRAVFSRSWQYVCHVKNVSNPGDFAVAQLGRTPVIIVRGKDGQLRGFVNACVHRLHPLATQSGHRNVLHCPYHAWTYELDGRLKSAPQSKNEKSFDCSAISLAPVAVETCDQWVFANPDPLAESLSNLVQPIGKQMKELNSDLADYRFSGRYEYNISCNWKLFVENALECYHCPTLHQSTLARAFATRPGEYHLESSTDAMWFTAPTRWLPTGFDPSLLRGMRFAFFYPGFICSIDDFVGFVVSIYPTGPESCGAFMDMYVNPGADRIVADQWTTILDETMKEDKLATEGQQLGYRSGRIARARLMLDSEHALQNFMRRTWSALAQQAELPDQR